MQLSVTTDEPFGGSRPVRRRTGGAGTIDGIRHWGLEQEGVRRLTISGIRMPPSTASQSKPSWMRRVTGSAISPGLRAVSICWSRHHGDLAHAVQNAGQARTMLRRLGNIKSALLRGCSVTSSGFTHGARQRRILRRTAIRGGLMSPSRRRRTVVIKRKTPVAVFYSPP